MSKYASVEEVQNFLIRTNVASTPDELPELPPVIETAEIELENWLGFSPAVQTYTERRNLEDNRIVLREYPVVEIQKVEGIFGDPEVRRDELSYYWWWGGNHIEILPSMGTIYEYPYKIVVTYKAGYDPLPRQFSLAFLELMRHLIVEGAYPGDRSSLYQPARDVQNLSVSGISKSWRIGKTAGNGETETMLDRLLAPLKKYQRKFFW